MPGESGNGSAQVPSKGHEDIMLRLLEYQRQMREGDPPPPPTETMPERPLMDFVAAEGLSAVESETPELVDLTLAEALLETTAADGGSEADPSDPVEPGGGSAKGDWIARVVERRGPQTGKPASVWAVPSLPTEGAGDDVPASLVELEYSLTRLSEMIGELRRRFQDMALASDERLAALEKAVEDIRRSQRV